MSMYNEITQNAFSGVPEEILAHDSIQDAIQYMDSWVDEFENNWIDPESDYYRESLSEAEHQGAYAVAEYYRKSLEEALYRQKMFGTQFDLERFIDGLHGVSVQEVLDEAR